MQQWFCKLWPAQRGLEGWPAVAGTGSSAGGSGWAGVRGVLAQPPTGSPTASSILWALRLSCSVSDLNLMLL